jgi:cell division protein ZapA
MAHVTVTINGRAYRMACDEGQEDHLTGLSDRFNTYISRLKGAFGEIGDQRLTVMAGIMILDEIHEMEKQIRSLEADIVTLKASRDEALAQLEENSHEMADSLSDAAERIEDIARKVTPSPSNSR